MSCVNIHAHSLFSCTPTPNRPKLEKINVANKMLSFFSDPSVRRTQKGNRDDSYIKIKLFYIGSVFRHRMLARQNLNLCDIRTNIYILFYNPDGSCSEAFKRSTCFRKIGVHVDVVCLNPQCLTIQDITGLQVQFTGGHLTCCVWYCDEILKINKK